MKPVICNSRGQHVECPNCSASKPHYNSSCEPCPFFPDAECLPLTFPMHLIEEDDTLIKILDISKYILIKTDKTCTLVQIGDNKGIVEVAINNSAIISKEAFETQFDNAIKLLQKTMYP